MSASVGGSPARKRGVRPGQWGPERHPPEKLQLKVQVQIDTRLSGSNGEIMYAKPSSLLDT